MEETPYLFPVTPVEFWKQMRMVIEEVVEEKLGAPAGVGPVAYLPEKTLLKVAEVCALFQVSKPTVYEWMKAGKLRSVKIRSRRYFLMSEIEGVIGEGRK